MTALEKFDERFVKDSNIQRISNDGSSCCSFLCVKIIEQIHFSTWSSIENLARKFNLDRYTASHIFVDNILKKIIVQIENFAISWKSLMASGKFFFDFFFD